MSNLETLHASYHSALSQAANIIDAGQARSVEITATQQDFIAAMFEFTRLAIAKAPDSVAIAALEEAHRLAQAVIAEANA